MDDTLMRIMFAYNVVGAGVVGAVVLLAPRFAASQIFAGTTEPNAAMDILGSIWLAVGAVSLLGIFFPDELSPIFVVQLVYKTVWLLGFAVPAFLAGRGRSVPRVMAAMFLVWVIVLPFAIPFGDIFG